MTAVVAALLVAGDASAQSAAKGKGNSAANVSSAELAGAESGATSAPAGGDLGKAVADVQALSDKSPLVQNILLVTMLAVAPAILVMVTSFTRIVVVLGLLRQALGSVTLPPNQVLFGLSLLMSVVVMAPTYRSIHSDAIEPYLAGKITPAQAVTASESHLRGFMIRQIEAGNNRDDVMLFMDEKTAAREDLTWREVPTMSLMPAFVISELKIAFLIGFQIYLPLLIIDMLVSGLLVSMGMLMMPPTMISLPFKLLLFVLANGWHLVVGTLIRSFG